MRRSTGLTRAKITVQSQFISRLPKAIFLCVIWAALFVASSYGAELSNDTLRLKLGVASDNVPAIEGAEWVATGEPVFSDLGTPDGLESWIPESLVPKNGLVLSAEPWQISEDANFFIAKARARLANELNITWVVELAKQGSLFRLHVCLKNTSDAVQDVGWFPAWVATWKLPGSDNRVRWWNALSYTPLEQELIADNKIKLGSQLHSSDSVGDGVNPYWVVGGERERIHFGLEWCGGWEAKLRGVDGGIAFSVRLPPEETQLRLQPGESIAGPALIVVPTAGFGDLHRHSWMSQRLALARVLYGGPAPSFPLTYNHWYAAGINVSYDFLKSQTDAMSPYGFDDFIVDAGWFQRVGKWKPDKKKFSGGEFEELLASVRSQGTNVGIWSCPQLVGSPADSSVVELSFPSHYSSFTDGYLLDLADRDFESYLSSHVALLRERYSAGWWKYDQEFFTRKSQAGAMKNVAAFQNALLAVRHENPDLVIENCQSGGRMINEFTLLATQVSWLQDGRRNGITHARDNIEAALGALDFIFPWAVYRWTNNLDRMNQDDDELTRYYCRSAMAGTWGISADLASVGDHQRSVILKEIENYRRLNQIKQDYRYSLQQPAEGSDIAEVTFYDSHRQSAGVLLYRWDREGAFDQRVTPKGLRPGAWYLVTDADTGAQTEIKGRILMEDGINVSFDGARLSALLFIEKIK